MDIILWGGIILAIVLFLVGMKIMKWVAWGLAIALLVFVGIRWMF